MHRLTLFISLILLGLSLHTGAALASDTAKEQRWRSQIVDALFVGEPVDLQADGQTFLGIYAAHDTDKPLGAAIVMHGIGVHPAWPDIVQPLRTELPARGWATLSIQMPILPNDADYKEYAPLYAEVPARINAAKTFLREQGYQNIVLIAHSLGSGMTTSYLAHGGSAAAFVAIGLDALTGFDDKRMDHGGFLGKITIPVLDLYGSQDLEGVLNTADDRAQAAKKAGNNAYRQQQVAGANHFFQGKETELVNIVSDWLAEINK
jgi:pimeloyl-ACP methyl ester carboxylesterase